MTVKHSTLIVLLFIAGLGIGALAGIGYTEYRIVTEIDQTEMFAALGSWYGCGP